MELLLLIPESRCNSGRRAVGAEAPGWAKERAIHSDQHQSRYKVKNIQPAGAIIYYLINILIIFEVLSDVYLY